MVHLCQIVRPFDNQKHHHDTILPSAEIQTLKILVSSHRFSAPCYTRDLTHARLIATRVHPAGCAHVGAPIGIHF